MGGLFSQVRVAPGRRWIPAVGEHHASLVTMVLNLTFLSVGLSVVFRHPLLQYLFILILSVWVGRCYLPRLQVLLLDKQGKPIERRALCAKGRRHQRPDLAHISK